MESVVNEHQPVKAGPCRYGYLYFNQDLTFKPVEQNYVQFGTCQPIRGKNRNASISKYKSVKCLAGIIDYMHFVVICLRIFILF